MTHRERATLYAAAGVAYLDMGFRFIEWKWPFMSVWCLLVATMFICWFVSNSFSKATARPL